jgi:hypothetical protein
MLEWQRLKTEVQTLQAEMVTVSSQRAKAA